MNENDIPFKIVRGKRKTIAIHVMPDMSVVVKAPKKAAKDTINDFFISKRRWIMKQIDFFRQVKRIDCEVANGAEFFFLGKQYRMIIKKADLREYVSLEDEEIVIYSFFPQQVDRLSGIFLKWLETETEKCFKEELLQCIETFPKMPMPNLKIRKLKRRWGSFIKKSVNKNTADSKNNTIVLNKDLIAVDKKCIDYVITHELCHYYHMNHSKAFYELLTSKIFNWKKLKEQLEKSPIVRID